MKKALFCIVLTVTLCNICSCTIPIPPHVPDEGIWYCKELGIAVEFDSETANEILYRECQARGYISSTEYIDMKASFLTRQNLLNLTLREDKSACLVGYYNYNKGKFEIITSNISIDDDFNNSYEQIDLGDKAYSFVEIDSYDDVKTPNENNIIKYFFQ